MSIRIWVALVLVILILTPAAAQRPGIEVVVLDPGHGGLDTGQVGAGGIKESEITLSICRRLKDEIQRELGLKVYLTRSDDYLVPLEDRPALANNRGAVLFISIHAQGAIRSEIKGIETYFLSPQPKMAEKKFGQRQEEEKLEVVPWEMAQARYRGESQLLAKILQARLVSMTLGDDRGVREAPIYVLKGVPCPAVIIEVGFLSNLQEGQNLSSSLYQDLITGAITAGIKEFMNKVE